IGTGAALTPAMDAVLGALPPDRSGSGTALTMTFRQVGAALGVAVLGSVLASAYQGAMRADLRVPASASGVAQQSVAAAHEIATATRDAAIARAGDAAYLAGMDRVLLVCAIVALAGALAAAIGLPVRARTAVGAEESAYEPADIA
ncbi:MAG TPA: hypothetical protein VH442_16725, partial [Micromonosporaceae bacterium]